MNCIGIDTSNYTTSLAYSADKTMQMDLRTMLKVREGERGLRQSDALYQHWTNLPDLTEKLLAQADRSKIDLIVASSRPRSVEGSYMPVFNAGTAAARMIGAAMNIPVKFVSHQDGHIMAASVGNDIDFRKPLIAAHLSGGTLELVLLKDGKIAKIGGTKDISYGQLLDRIGVAMGNLFPAGKAIDSMAVNFTPDIKNPLCKATIDGSYLNLSGLETQALNFVSKKVNTEFLPAFVMERIAQSFVEIVKNAMKEQMVEQVLVAGGVACSEYLRNSCSKYGFMFGIKNLCSDNAVGAAISEGELPWL